MYLHVVAEPSASYPLYPAPQGTCTQRNYHSSLVSRRHRHHNSNPDTNNSSNNKVASLTVLPEKQNHLLKRAGPSLAPTKP